MYAAADVNSDPNGLDYGIYKVLPDGSQAWPNSGPSFLNGALVYDNLHWDDSSTCLSHDPLNNIYVGGLSFGPNGTTDINLVKFGAEHSQFIYQTFPSTMTTGHSYGVSITFKNTGTTTWTAAKGYKLAPIYPIWGVASLPLAAGDSIAPGQSKTFTFTVTAPSTKGTANTRWTMQRSSTMFGAETKLLAVAVG